MTTTVEDLATAVERKRALSDAERRVLVAVSYGYTNGEIARRLNIAEDTVKTHLRRISQGWGIASRAGKVGYALRNGVIQ